MRKALLIDDIRTLPIVGLVVARTYEDGIRELRDNGPWDILYLDHDLSVDAALGQPAKNEKTGYSVMCWLEEHPECLPTHIEFVTLNPVGRERMKLVYERLYGGRQ